MPEWSDVVAKIMPIEKLYDDAVAPAAKQVGRLGGDAAKAARLILAPIQGLAHLQDRMDAMFERMAKRIPQERLIEVSPEISGPAIDTMVHLDDRSELWRLLEEILTKAMDSETVRLAHPAFVIIAKQLAPDEIRILFRLNQSTVELIDAMDLDDQAKKFINRTLVSNSFDIDLIVPSQFDLFMHHLQVLGLITWVIQDQIPVIGENGKQTGVTRRSEIALSDFGKMFVEAGTQRTIDA